VGAKLFKCRGGDISLPDSMLVLVGRSDGGNLIVNPPRDVWERGELTPDELTQWSFLVAAVGRGMLDALPQLDGGCVNYWEAGNWTLNERAEPVGAKTAVGHRKVHLHLLGRSRAATDPSWRWGEAPKFPDFAERHSWASNFERLSAEECRGVVVRAEALLRERYGMSDIAPWSLCEVCGYPTPAGLREQTRVACSVCSEDGEARVD
jgi:hypothetical protein